MRASAARSLRVPLEGGQEVPGRSVPTWNRGLLSILDSQLETAVIEDPTGIDAETQSPNPVEDPDASSGDAQAGRHAWLKVLVGIVVSPRDSFEIIRQRRPWVGASLLLLAASTVQFLLVWRHFSEASALTDFNNLFPSAGTLMLFGGATSTMIGLVIGWLVQALVVWLLAVAFRGEATFARSFSLTVHVAVITCLAGFAGLLLSMGRSLESIESFADLEDAVTVPGLNLLFSTDNAILDVIYMSITPFSIWHLILLGLGAAAVFQLAPRRGLTIAGIYWAATTALAAAMAGVASLLPS